MSPIAIWFVSGCGYLTLLALVALALLGSVSFRSGRLVRSLLTSGILASLLLLLTGSPVSNWLHGGLVAVVGVQLLLSAKQSWRSPFVASACLALGVTLLAAILEFRTWAAPRFEKRVEGLVVVGDSLSAGIKSGERTWPIELGSRLGVPVANRSRAGAHADSGVELLGAQTLSGQTVIILLGGNDMLSGGDASDYGHNLDTLVSAVKASGGLPILIQFPAIPARGAFPAAVARVARRHEVPMIHRRLLASVLGMRGSTVDGLHLSESGHHALAEAMQKILSTR